MKLFRKALPLAFAVIAAVPALQAQTAGYHITHRYDLGVKDQWDYLAFDPATHLLYIAAGEHVIVFDASAGKVAHVFEGLKHMHGFYFAADGKTGYMSDGGANVVRIFDRITYKELGQIPVGVNPDGLAFEPVTGHLFVFNGKSKEVMAVDLGIRKVIATMQVEGKPEFPTADGEGFVYDNIEDTHQIVKIDARTNKIAATWLIAGCESPTGMAADAAAHRIMSVCDNKKMVVTDTATGKTVATAPIGEGADAVVRDAEHNMLFASNGDNGTLSIIRQKGPNTFATIGTVKTVPQGRTLTRDPRTGKLYIVAPDPKVKVAKNAISPFVLLEISK